MTIEVEMTAFAQGQIRKVTVPDNLARSLLDAVFYYGQNDFCTDEDRKQELPSVSVGDIIRAEGKRFVVLPLGFKEVPADFQPPLDDGGIWAYTIGGSYV